MDIAALTTEVESISQFYAERTGIQRTDDWLLLKLNEEVGELTQAFLAVSGQARDKGRSDAARRDDLAAELADVLAHTLLIAHRFGIDLDDAVQRKWLFWNATRTADVTVFSDAPPPPGASPWVEGAEPDDGDVAIVPSDPAWAERYRDLAAVIRSALGPAALAIEHVGSTSVPGLAAKPVIDIDLTVADSADEAAYVPALEAAGFRLRVREPWWYGHRMLRLDDPLCNLHVWSPDTPEPVRHVLFRDWLRRQSDDRDLYRDAKLAAAAAANEHGETVMQYNARKQEVIREIYRRAFRAAGLIG